MSKIIEIDLTARRRNNLKVLKTIDENIIEIIADYSHVAAYQYDEVLKKWDRLDVEGSLFIVRSIGIPFYSLIILNKKGPVDFILDLSTILKLSLQEPYLMLRCVASSEASTVFGIWLHNEVELNAIYSLLVRISLKKERPICHSPESKAGQLLSLLKPIKLLKPTNEEKVDIGITPSSSLMKPLNKANLESSDNSSMRLLSILKSPLQSNSSKSVSTSSVISTNIVQPLSPPAQIQSPTSYASALRGRNVQEIENKPDNYSGSGSDDSKIVANSQKSLALKSLLSGFKKEITSASNRASLVEHLNDHIDMPDYSSGGNKISSVSVALTPSHKTKEELLLAMVRSRPHDNTATSELLTDNDIATKQKITTTTSTASMFPVNNNSNKSIISNNDNHITNIRSEHHDTKSNVGSGGGDGLEKQNLLKSILFNKLAESNKAISDTTTSIPLEPLPPPPPPQQKEVLSHLLANRTTTTLIAPQSNASSYYQSAFLSASTVNQSNNSTSSDGAPQQRGGNVLTTAATNTTQSSYFTAGTTYSKQQQQQQQTNSNKSVNIVFQQQLHISSPPTIPSISNNSNIIPPSTIVVPSASSSKQIVLISPSDLKSISKAI